MKNKFSTLILTAIFPALLFAQPSYEIDVHYGFGASELAFNSVPGFAVSLYPIKNVGFSLGLEYSWRWRTKTNEQSGTNPIILDNSGDSLIFNYKIDSYKEELYGQILQIPILLKYSNDLYYTAAGLKIGITQKANANINYRGLKTEGYYPEYALTLTEPLFQGFGMQRDTSYKTKISSKKTSVMLALEGGIKLKLNDNFALLAGVFADYSFNKVFDRDLPLVERVENSDGAAVVVNSTWKSWRPWSVGAVIKLSFSYELEKNPEEEEEEEDIIKITKQEPQEPVKEIIDTSHSLVIKPETPPHPVAVLPPPPLPPSPPPRDTFPVRPIPDFLLNREADFVFNYPETHTSPSDSVHLALISQIADTLKAKPNSQLHCVGYSEKLVSAAAAYEIAYQRSFHILYTLSNFFGINEKRIFIYSKGSEGSGYRRTECFVR